MPRKIKKPLFRFCRSTIGLTWSCPVELTDNPIADHQVIKEHFDYYGTNEYLISKEMHEDGKVHWHAYCKWDHTVESTSCHFMDIAGVHPNILPKKPGKGWLHYIVKDCDYITNFYEACNFSTALRMDSPDEAIDYLWSKQPRLMMCQAHNICTNVRQRLRTHNNFICYCGPYLQSWLPTNWDPTQQSLLIFGRPGIGKTNFGRYLLSPFGQPDYIKGTLANLKNLRFDSPLLFDEISMLHDDPEQSKEITDVPNGGTIKARYSDIIIPPGIPRIFLSNYERPFRNPCESVYGHRVTTLHLEGPNLRFG